MSGNTKQRRKTRARKERQQLAWERFYRDSVRKGRPAGYLAELRRISFDGLSTISKQKIVEGYGR